MRRSSCPRHGLMSACGVSGFLSSLVARSSREGIQDNLSFAAAVSSDAATRPTAPTAAAAEWPRWGRPAPLRNSGSAPQKVRPRTRPSRKQSMANALEQVCSSVSRHLSCPKISCLSLWTLGHQIADEKSGVGTIFKLDLDNDLAKVGGKLGGGELGRGSSSSPRHHGWGLTRCWPQGSRAGKPHATSDEPQLINRSFDGVSMHLHFQPVCSSRRPLCNKTSAAGSHSTHQHRNAVSPKSALISLPRFPGAGPGGPVLTSRWHQQGLDTRESRP